MVDLEVSLPKLLLGNNVEELGDADYGRLIQTLRSRLYEMGIKVEEETLHRAEVRMVHFGKNIVLDKGITSRYVIRELQRMHIPKYFDLTRAKFTNDGEILYAYCKNHSFVFYDKVADLKKGSRAVDRDQSVGQISLFDSLDNSLEILRFEVRLNDKRKMARVLGDVGLQVGRVNMKDIFSHRLAMDTLQSYYKRFVTAPNRLLIANQLPTEKLLEHIYTERPTARMTTVLRLFGLLVLAIDGPGMRYVRHQLESRGSSRNWQNQWHEIKQLADTLPQQTLKDWHRCIINQLSNYQPITQAHYEQQ